MTQFMKALCCTCGSIRECRRPRNYRQENYWLSGPIDLDWHRETGDLKCHECGQITTHALIRPEGDRFRDHAEIMQGVATGNSHSFFTDTERIAVATKYRQGLPRNPELHHLWWILEAQTAWDEGRAVRALCGEQITVHRDPTGPSSTTYDEAEIEPRRARDQDYEDPDTGLSWMDLDCVDCLRVWHLELLRRRRKELESIMTDLMTRLIYAKSELDLHTVDSLIDVLDSTRKQLPR